MERAGVSSQDELIGIEVTAVVGLTSVLAEYVTAELVETGTLEDVDTCVGWCGDSSVQEVEVPVTVTAG